MERKELISVVAVTYQSELTILRTLKSIVEQDYGPENIELVIGDDCSSDATVEIIKVWIDENSHRFFNVIFLQNSSNNGTVANLDRALRIATGTWIKTIAGDDILRSHCLSTYVQYLKKSNGRVIFSLMESFKEIEGTIILLGDIFPSANQKKVLYSGIEAQRTFLNYSCFTAAPTAFIQKSLLEEVDYLDLDYRLLEDYPLWSKIIDYGVSIELIDEITVLYRIGNSTSRTNDKIINSILLNDIVRFENELIRKSNYAKLRFFRKKIWVYFYPKLITIFENKRTFLSKWIIFIFNSFFKYGYFYTIIKCVLRDK